MEALLNWLTWLCLAILAYHYLGYPLLLWFLSRIHPRTRVVQPTAPSVSLIIAAYNEAGVIAEKLENSLALDYPDLEIIVVSDGSDDATPSIVEKYANQGVISLHQAPRQGKSHAINRATRQATGEILLLSDANALYGVDAVHQLVQHFADPAVGCVTGKKVVSAQGIRGASAEGEGLYWRYESLVKQLESQLNSTAGVVGEIIAVRKEIFKPIPAGVVNDDVYLGLFTQRSGYTVVYEPNAVSHERPLLSMRDDFVRRRRMTAGRFQALFHPAWWPWNNPVGLFFLWSHKFLRLLLPFFMIGAFSANVALVAIAGPALLSCLTLAGQLLFYGLALTGYLAERRHRSWRVPALAYYIAHGNLASLHGLARYLSGRQSVRWQKAAR